MNLAPVLDLLRERTGLDPTTLGGEAVRLAITTAMRRLGLEDPVHYSDRARHDATVFHALVEDIVVPETWFFRGGIVFEFLARHIRSHLRGRLGGPPFRILSLPCSTGEEPYSLVLALVEMGVTTGWHIDGVDISQRNLEAARQGIFPELSFRQMPEELKRRYFTPAARGWQLRSDLLPTVRFLAGNLLDPGLLALERPYDLVFCRNLFIYLTPEARRQGQAALTRLVAPGGLLCLGHVDPLDQEGGTWQRFGPEGCFLFLRAPRATAPPSAPLAVPLPPAPVPALSRSVPAFAEPPSELPTLLNQARQLADSGRLDDALALCQSAESRHGAHAEVCALLGIIHQARHETDQAVHRFRRALFLDPDHREALMHLMLLYQHLGEYNQAAVLSRRLERLAASGAGGDQ